MAARGARQSGFGVSRQEPADAAQRVRHVVRVRGQRLTDQLRPTDEALEVVDEPRYGTPPPPAPAGDPDHGKSRLQRLCEITPVILTVHVRSQQSALTPSGDWVQTTIRGEIVEVLKNTLSKSLSAGDEVALSGTGGEVIVGRQKIRAYDRGTSPWRYNSTYLVFAQSLQGDVYSAHNTGWLLDQGDFFASLTGGAGTVVPPTVEKDAVLRDIATCVRARQ